MKKNWKPLIITFLLISIVGTSCLTVNESFFFRKDGSGSAKIEYDLTQMMALLDMMGSMGGDSTEMPDMNDLWESTEVVDALTNLDGISNVKNLTNKEKKVFGFSYDFANVEALNRSLSATKGPDLGAEMGMGGAGGDGATFSLNKKSLSRKFPKLSPPEETSEEDLGMMSAMMGEASYNITYSFEQKVKKVSAKRAEITNQENNSVTIKGDFIKMMKDEQSMDVSIKLK